MHFHALGDLDKWVYFCAFFTGRNCFHCVSFSEKNYLYKHGDCAKEILYWLVESGHVSKPIPLPLPKLKNSRHLLFLRQDIPAAQWHVHFVIWLLATKCSLVSKYILRFSGNLKKKSVPESDSPHFTFSLPPTLCLCRFASLYIIVPVVTCGKTRFGANVLLLPVRCFRYIDRLGIVRSWVGRNSPPPKSQTPTVDAAARGFLDHTHLLC